ncbi:MAG: GNAT family N-acetyltransferase [Saprospiraceae bacterium]|nr:GNAT family N-acetyltransferase [Saprospiraceae bacterium]
MDLIFKCLPFNQLDIFQLYEIMALRQEVFVVEQNCPYLDADGKDPKGWHLLGLNTENQIIAYARLLPKEVSYPDYPSIGRIATAANARGTGAGRALVQEALLECNRLFGNESIKIGAQLYLLKFYQSFGFESVGEEYLEDGIPHIEMIKPSFP